QGGGHLVFAGILKHVARCFSLALVFREWERSFGWFGQFIYREAFRQRDLNRVTIEKWRWELIRVVPGFSGVEIIGFLAYNPRPHQQQRTSIFGIVLSSELVPHHQFLINVIN